MKEKLKNYFRQKTNRQKTKGQSLVEFTLTLPVLLILLSGLTEFGFMLNYYLSLVDASREVARLFSNYDHEYVDPDTGRNFYEIAADQVVLVLEPSDSNDTTRKIEIHGNLVDPTKNHPNDIIVSVYSVSGGVAVPLNVYHWSGHQTSRLNTAEINSRLTGTPPDSGVLVVEIFYNYEQVLKLPWLEMMPDPFVIHSFTIMPQSSSEPTPTPY
ncbi:MAG: hypothetical protein GY755_13865 [Chloroflexi bacterium]|nr:hypothetical protein [Chloroflexota bacterium]